MSRLDLAEANGHSVRSRLRRGQSLLIPRAPATLLATRTDRPAPSVLASRTVAEPPAAATADAVPASAGSAEDLARLEDVVVRHLVHFAFREELEIDWRPA